MYVYFNAKSNIFPILPTYFLIIFYDDYRLSILFYNINLTYIYLEFIIEFSAKIIKLICQHYEIGDYQVAFIGRILQKLVSLILL